MTHRWNQTIHIDKMLATQLIETQFDFPIASIAFLDEGWDNVAFLVNENLIFRFPRRELGLDCMKNEIAFLPYVAQHVNFSLSAPQWIGQPSAVYPYPFSGYPMIPGKSLTDVGTELIDDPDFATTLALWLKQLHSIPVKPEIADQFVGDPNWRLDVPAQMQKTRDTITRYEDYFIQAGFSIKELLHAVAQFEGCEFSHLNKSILHADLYHRHVIVDPDNLKPIGLIDWGDVHVGPVGIDLAVGMIFTERNFQHFLDAYGYIDDSMMAVLLLQALRHDIVFLAYGFQTNRPALKRWCYLQLTSVLHELKRFDR